MRIAIALIALVLLGGAAHAHALGADSAQSSPAATFVLGDLIGLACLTYAAGLSRIRRQIGMRVVTPGQSLAFGAGMSALVLILLSPLDAYADALLSLHMVQHLLLTLMIPPLLIWGRPALVTLWGLPRPIRKIAAVSWRRAGFDGLVTRLMHPLVVGLLFSASFYFWHLPQPYTWALGNGWHHALEHATLFVSALMFWSLVVEPSGHRRMGLATTIVFIAATAVVSGFPGALMLLSPEPLYPIHAAGAARWSLILLEDQQLAGLIMWVPAGLLWLAPIGWAFAKLLEEQARPAFLAPPNLAIALLLTLPLALGGCSEAASRAEGTRSDDRAKTLMVQFGCGACHEIPGIAHADGRVGPPLAGIADRDFIAGALRNTPENMQRWLRDPQSVVPGNAMPSVGATPEEAQVMAAYLATLHR